MKTFPRLTAYALGLVAVFGAALGAGHLVGPTAPAPPARGDAHGSAMTEGHGDGHAGGAVPELPGGLQVAQDGYTVTLAGNLTPGRSSRLTLSVHRGGAPVTDLQPYLGAYGHLVALRDGDLAYLHVHPDGAPSDGRTAAGPDIAFHAEVPSAGAYRLYLDFQHGGTVRTAEFTLIAGHTQG